VVVSLLGAGCATRVPAIGAGGEPFRFAPGERELWDRAEREERRLLERVTLHADPDLDSYLLSVADRLGADDLRAGGGPRLAVRVVRDPTANAFALPHGRLYVHTGLLAHLASEAQLAAVLAHALVHVAHRHALRLDGDAPGRRARRAAVTGRIEAARTTGPDGGAGAPLGPTAGAILGLDLPLATTAALAGYGGDLEREAAEAARLRLARAGFHPRAADEVLETLRRADVDGLAALYLARHAAMSPSVRAGAARGAGPAPGAAAGHFAVRVRAAVRDNAQLDLAAGRFDVARRQLDRVLALTPRDPVALVADGDLHRLHAQRATDRAERADLLRRALDRYVEAAAIDPTYADPHRQRGLLHYQEGDLARARAAFRQYLTLAPGAPDAARIREYTAGMER
jgi:predicted Zn-dependent protease